MLNPKKLFDAAPAEVVEDFRAFDEESPLLVEERLVRRQIDHGRIDFGLTEIRVDGGVEHEAARHRRFDVEADRAEHARAVVERVAVLRPRRTPDAPPCRAQAPAAGEARTPSRLVRCIIRDARPSSFFGQNSSHTVSFLRRMKRDTLKPHV